MKRALLAGLVLLVSPVTVAALSSGPIDTQSGPTAMAQSEIPRDLLGVYVTASYECPGLPWQVLAAIGFVESRHAQGRADPESGEVAPPIVGPAVDGRSGFAAIPDPSSPDGWAHAVGPMQFLTTTWRSWGIVAPDRPPGSVADPNNARDAIFTAARYLCGGRPQVRDLHAAVLRYNNSDAFYRDVIDKATSYGLGSGLPGGGTLAPGSGEAVVAAALTQLGVPYVWGGTTPGVGFDCSGLVQWAYGQSDVSLPRVTFDQIRVGVAVGVDELRPGDLVFTRSVRDGQAVDLGHVAIYAGGGYVIIAPRTGDVVSLRPLQRSAVQATRRIVG